MRALDFLERIGAIRKSSQWELMMSLVCITQEFNSLDDVIDPEFIEWVQESESMAEYELRCDAIMLSTSGDVRALYPLISVQTEHFLKSLISVLISIRVALFCREQGRDYSDKDDKDFVRNYNDMVSAGKENGFASKSEILKYYYSEELVETGKQIISQTIGSAAKFVKDVAIMQSFFASFVSLNSELVVSEVYFEDERKNPLEGGYQVRMILVDKEQKTTDSCTLHWAPWPNVKHDSKNKKVIEICSVYNQYKTREWLDAYT